MHRGQDQEDGLFTSRQGVRSSVTSARPPGSGVGSRRLMQSCIGPRELRKCRLLVDSLTPSESTYGDYRTLAGAYAEGHAVRRKPLTYGERKIEVRRFRWIRSILFERRYLVGEASPGDLGTVAPHRDAITCEIEFDALDMKIPIVLVPWNRLLRGTVSFRAVIEHEFIHVSQSLHRAYPGPMQVPTAKEFLRFLLDGTRAEYQATFVELATWPAAGWTKSGVPLEDWSVLTGYTSTLELALVQSASVGLRRREVSTALSAASRILPRRAASLTGDPRVRTWVSHAVVSHIAKALELVGIAAPDLRGTETLQSAAAWCLRRLPRKASSRAAAGGEAAQPPPWL